MGKKWAFRSFLKNWQTDMFPSTLEGRFIILRTCANFLQNWVKRGQKEVKLEFFVTFSKTFLYFFYNIEE